MGWGFGDWGWGSEGAARCEQGSQKGRASTGRCLDCAWSILPCGCASCRAPAGCACTAWQEPALAGAGPAERPPPLAALPPPPPRLGWPAGRRRWACCAWRACPRSRPSPASASHSSLWPPVPSCTSRSSGGCAGRQAAPPADAGPHLVRARRMWQAWRAHVQRRSMPSCRPLACQAHPFLRPCFCPCCTCGCRLRACLQAWPSSPGCWSTPGALRRAALQLCLQLCRSDAGSLVPCSFRAKQGLSLRFSRRTPPCCARPSSCRSMVMLAGHIPFVRQLAPQDAAALCTLVATLAVARSPASAVRDLPPPGFLLLHIDAPACMGRHERLRCTLQLGSGCLPALPTATTARPCADCCVEGDRGQGPLLQPGHGGGGGQRCAAVCDVCGQH